MPNDLVELLSLGALVMGLLAIGFLFVGSLRTAWRQSSREHAVAVGEDDADAGTPSIAIPGGGVDVATSLDFSAQINGSLCSIEFEHVDRFFIYSQPLAEDDWNEVRRREMSYVYSRIGLLLAQEGIRVESFEALFESLTQRGAAGCPPYIREITAIFRDLGYPPLEAYVEAERFGATIQVGTIWADILARPNYTLSSSGLPRALAYNERAWGRNLVYSPDARSADLR